MKKEFIEIERKGNEIEAGMGATGRYWTDCYAYEVVRVISDKTIEIRRLKAERVPGTDWLDEDYNYYIDENASVERVRKFKYGWKTKDCMKVSIGHAKEYRDPSF